MAVDILNRQLRTGISDEDLAERVIELREEGRLCIVHEEKKPKATDHLLARITSQPLSGTFIMR